MADYLVDEMSPYHLQMSMFVTTIREQGDEAQRNHWLPQIEAWKIIGAYAQTEQGHGSNVRGLELQARWDPKKKEFELHSPTLTASKWWNGALGRTATHAIVVAQLLLPQIQTPSIDAADDAEPRYVSHGPHPFVVRIRDQDTHQPLPGIVVGDIGPKYGYTSMDNGYMLFNHFRVPHAAMLARYSRVDPETSAFQRTGSSAVVYGSLTNVRANIIMHARLVLARAVTIAVRYCSIRRQFKDRDALDTESIPETVVLDYPTVMIRVLPLLATTFALHYTGEAMYELYRRSRESIEGGDFGSLAELHSTSSGLKSLCTMYAADGIEICRRAMGGHGFGGGSGLVQINADYLSKPTVEGDNWMITQQVSNYLIKKMTAAVEEPHMESKDALSDHFRRYLKQRTTARPQEVITSNGTIDDTALVEAFKWRAATLSYQAYQQRIVQKQRWNTLLISLHKLSRAYSESILVTNFHSALQNSPLSEPTRSTMRDLFHLYALHTIDSDARTFQTTGALSAVVLDAIPDRVLDIMTQKVRPHAVKLVDSWAIPDYLLDSALGRYDGKVYEELFQKAHRENPLNRVTFNVDWRSSEIVKGDKDSEARILAKL
ncbi:acyl-CoA oxidase [Viridothelium virens]|uniref:Acyl-coenzyme A oxidase n=1 Tax=Viridothelium virens TaxID=1048519 RepID=A0A6A6GUZ4_VIRVR|nr:acyl-CoA oxidase [Viridothelium virens]